jgi:hypothetical protein
MKPRTRAGGKSTAKAGTKPMAMASAAAKRIAAAKKSAPKKRKLAPAKKAAAAKKPATAKKPVVPPAKPAPAAPRLATPIPSGGAAARPPVQPPRPAAPARPVAAQSADERRKAATRKFFARLRSLEAIVGADLRKRGSLVLMQAVDQWYNEAISVTATDVTITNAAKAVIAHL